MAATYQQYASWSPSMQARYRARYGKAPAGFTPFKPPTSPPAGTYDPALDAALRASGRGYFDLLAQNATNSLRAGEDYNTATGRENAAFQTATERANQNYGTQTADLGQQYQRLGSQQTQQANAAGISGGALLQALRKRNANQQHDQSAIDVAHERQLADLNTSHSNSLADMLSQYTRGQLDQGTQQAIAGRELGFSQQDTNAEKLFSAEQGGYVPPVKPANEHSANGVTWRTLGPGRYRLPSGRVVNWARILKLRGR